MVNVFLSYSRRDEDFARKLATSLSSDSATVWLDIIDIPAGMNWSSAIQEGLDSSDLMIVIITPGSMSSQNVENEWQYFLDKPKPVIPILLEPTERTHYQLKRIQYIDFHRLDYAEAYQKLLSEIERKGLFISTRYASDTRKISRFEIPPILPFIILGLSLGVAALILEFLLRLVRSGDVVVSAVTAIFGLGITFLPLLYINQVRDQFEKFRIPILGKNKIVASQTVVILCIIALRQPLLESLIQQKFDAVIRAVTIQSAQVDLDSVVPLGADMPTFLESQYLNAIENRVGSMHPDILAPLVHEYIPPTTARYDALVEATYRRVMQTVTSENAMGIEWAQALAELDSSRASQLLYDFNDQAVEVMNEDSPNIPQSRRYLEIIRILDDSIMISERDDRAKSVSRYNLGYVYELDDGLQGHYVRAAEAYREALTFDVSNLDARYALSLLLLTEFSTETESLSEAVDVAHRGWETYLNGGGSTCWSMRSVTNNTFPRAWYCFGLLTTEAGSRFSRNDPSQGDTKDRLSELLLQAIHLAENNSNFRGFDYWTGEAYYWLARVTEPDMNTDLTESDIELLCNVVEHSDPALPRHAAWRNYANQRLGLQACN